MIIILSALVYIFFLWQGMQYYPSYFAIIPTFYILMGFVLSMLYGEYSGRERRPSLKLMLMVRMLKIAGSIIILLIGILFDQEHMFPFVILFAAYYIIYLVFEAKTMIDLNKK